MKRLDVFYTDEDGHRVRPLIRFLELQELDVRQHTSPANKRSAPYLVIVSEHYAQAPWLVELTMATDAIAVLLVDAALDDSVRTTDLRAWPARSADRALASLAEWMKSPSAGVPPASAGMARKAGRRNEQTQNRGALVVLILVMALLAWLVTLTPEQASEALPEAVETPIQAARDTTDLRVPATSITDVPSGTQTPPSRARSPSEARSQSLHFASGSIVEHAMTRRAICQRLWSLDSAGPQCWTTPHRFSWDPRYLPGEPSPAA